MLQHKNISNPQLHIMEIWEKEYGKNIFKMKLKLFLENQKQSFNFKFPDKLELKC